MNVLRRIVVPVVGLLIIAAVATAVVGASRINPVPGLYEARNDVLAHSGAVASLAAATTSLAALPPRTPSSTRPGSSPTASPA